MLDVIVIGGGPAGIGATAYCSHLGLDTIMISPDVGGKINQPFSIKNFTYNESVHGTDLVRAFAAKIDQERRLTELVSSIEPFESGFRVRLQSGESCEGRALIIATGAKARRLYIPGEDALFGRGLSYSAISHAPIFAGRVVAVIGNDHRAQIAALEVARFAHSVLFITPQPQTLDPNLMERIKERGNTTLFKGWEPVSIEGQDFVSGITLQSSNRLLRKLQVDGVIVELGLIPHSDLVAELVECDEYGRIRVNQHAATSHPAIFAAGDVTDVHGEQVPVAFGEGLKASISAMEYLSTLPLA